MFPTVSTVPKLAPPEKDAMLLAETLADALPNGHEKALRRPRCVAYANWAPRGKTSWVSFGAGGGADPGVAADSGLSGSCQECARNRIAQRGHLAACPIPLADRRPYVQAGWNMAEAEHYFCSGASVSAFSEFSGCSQLAGSSTFQSFGSHSACSPFMLRR